MLFDQFAVLWHLLVFPIFPRRQAMNTSLDLRVTELLAARLCHDLVGPIGAVNNGLELLADDPQQSEALGLVGRSARRAASAVQFYRLAYGAGASGDDPIAVQGLILDWLSATRVAFSWSDDLFFDELPQGAGKLLLNLVELAGTALPQGGGLTAQSGASDGVSFLAITAAGTGAKLRDDLRAALTGKTTIDDLNSRTVQAFFTCYIVRRMGGEFLLNEAVRDHIQFVVSFASATGRSDQ